MSAKPSIIKNIKVTNKIIETNDNLDELDTLSNMLDEQISNEIKFTNSFNKNIKSKQIEAKLIKNTSDIYDSLDNETSENIPKNYGNKWSDEDKKQLIDFLKKNKNKEIDYLMIADKLGRSEGGVKGEVKKMIITRYLSGEEADNIALDLNVQYKFIKMLIRSYIDNEIDNDIISLEKENKFLKLKMENIELRKNILNLTKKK